MFHIDGEPFHLVLVPAYIPNGVGTVRQMRSALVKTFQSARGVDEGRKGVEEEILNTLNLMEGRTASIL